MANNFEESVLFKAILSMDSYTRGYDAGIEFYLAENTVSKQIGDYTITAHSSDLTNSNGDTNVDDDIGFYAMAYLTNPEIFKTETLPIRIETGDAPLAAGQSLVDKEKPDHPSVTVIRDLDR